MATHLDKTFSIVLRLRRKLDNQLGSLHLMIAIPNTKRRNRLAHHSCSATRSIASLPPSVKASSLLSLTLFCIFLACQDVSLIGVAGFVIKSRTVERKMPLLLVPISHDVAGVSVLQSSSLQSPLLASTSHVPQGALHKIEEKTFADSRFNCILSPSASTTALLAVESSENDVTDIKNIGTNKRNFFSSLDTMETLNGATKERSELLAKMIDEKNIVSVGRKYSDEAATASSIVPTLSYENPGSAETFLASGTTAPVAAGTWKVIYAPHMTTAMNLFRGRFDVMYDLFPDRRIVSHAYYDFPLVGKGYLSVSGTYGSVDDDDTYTYSRVDFDKAWIKALPSSTSTSASASAAPYESLDAVPDSLLKTIINEVGKRAFIESVAVFPVSFLDDDTIVFEFEFLGTKICAHKV